MSETNEPERTNPAPLGPDYTDAQWAADEAARCLRAGRFRLAASFARLAAQAEDFERMEAVRAAAAIVPLVGSTREETPARPTVPSEALTDVVDLGDRIRAAAEQHWRPMIDQYDDAARTALNEPTGQLKAVPNDDPGVTRVDPFAGGLGERAEAAAARLFGPVQVDQTAGIVRAPEPRRCVAIVIRQGLQDECHAVARFVWTSPGAGRWTHLDESIDADHAPEVGN